MHLVKKLIHYNGFFVINKYSCGNGHANEDELTLHFKTHSAEGNKQAQVFVKEHTEEAQSDNDNFPLEVINVSENENTLNGQ